MKTLRVESVVARSSLLWIAVLVIAPSASQDLPRIKNLDCVNDFDSKMVCFWEVVNGGANCSSDFQLKCRDEIYNKIVCCQVLDNEYYENSRIPNKCICHIDGLIIIGDVYDIEVESKGQIVGNASISTRTSVKPKTPSNLYVDLTKPENGVAQWKTNYDRGIITNNLAFHIQIISKIDNKTELEHVFTQLEPRYTFSKRQLTRGAEYRARVRAKHAVEEQTKEIWSDWSPEIVFTNNYTLTFLDYQWVIILLSCIVIVLITVSCYFAIIRTKKNWWNNIPDPAKSKLAKGNVMQQNSLKPVGKPSARKSCGNCLAQLVKAHTMSMQESFTKEHLVKDYQNLMGSSMKINIFEPEKVDIEYCLHLYPRELDNLYQGDSPEDKEEDVPLMITDFSINNMFSDILCDSSMKVDNSFGSFGSLDLRDGFQKTERHLQLSMVSQESGYQSYDSDDSPGDLKSDSPSSLYLDQSSLSQGDFLPYAPVSSMNEGGSQLVKEDAFINSGYNSFAKALAEVRCDITEGDNVSLFSLGSIFCKPYYHQNPKSILYSNTRCFLTHDENYFRPTMTPTSDYGDGAHTTSVSEGSGYQSFNQAIQQGEMPQSTTCLVFDSGYKPFESLTRISTCSLDNINDSSDLDNPNKDSIQNNEDHLTTGMDIVEGHPWDKTQSSDYHLTEFNFYNRKYPPSSETSENEHKGSVKQTSDIYYGMNKTLNDGLAQETDKPLALTFDIRNLANMQGLKTSLELEFAGFPITKPLFLEKAPITDDLLDEKCLNISKDFPVKFENMSYFIPLYLLKSRGYGQINSHLLVEQNNMDGEDNSYMKIALW
ncbi:interleukin-4 receptor subunit alpha [Anomaloglossus baeobatrachus]|uniref:interleukin-4 receptor subunit alpha n=1 Tax=Anomaloglossus baeobatrachus TaxID=238106 RepID=UPI003F500337